MNIAAPGSPKTYLRSWTAPLFAAALSAMTLIPFWLVRPHSYEASFPAFFGFLPMAFFFMRTAFEMATNQPAHTLDRLAPIDSRPPLFGLGPILSPQRLFKNPIALFVCERSKPNRNTAD